MIQKLKTLVSNPLFFGSIVMVGGSMGVNVINLFYHFVMGDLLSPVDYGILLSLYSVLYILCVVPISSSMAVVKFISSAKNQDERAKIYTGVKNFVFRVAIVGAFLMIVLSPLVAKFLNISDVWGVVLTAGVLFFSLITLVNQSSLQGILKFFGVVGPNFVSSVIKLGLGVFLVVLGFSVRGAMFAVVVGVGFAYVLSAGQAAGKFKSTSKEKFELGPFLKYSGPVLVQALAFTSLFTTDVILAKHFLSPLDAGLYAALSTLGKIVYFGASPVAQVMFPHVSGKHAKGENYLKILFGALALTFVICFGVVAIYYLFPDVVMGILYRKYLAAKDNLVWMGLFIAFHTVATLLVSFSLSINKTKIVLLPLIFAFLQIILIWFYHGAILQIIQISLIEMIVMCVMLGGWLGYNELWRKSKPTRFFR